MYLINVFLTFLMPITIQAQTSEFGEGTNSSVRSSSSMFPDLTSMVPRNHRPLKNISESRIKRHLSRRGFSNIGDSAVHTFSDNSQPTINLSTMITEGSGWTKEAVIDAYSEVNKLFSEGCGIGIGKVKILNAKWKRPRTDISFNTSCGKGGGPLVCRPGIQDASGTGAELAVASYAMGRPAVYFMPPPLDEDDFIHGYSSYQRNGLKDREISGAISEAEATNLSFYNMTRHTSFIRRTAKQDSIKTLAHELVHQLLGSCGKDSPRNHHSLGGLMDSNSKSMKIKHLCDKIKKSNLLKTASK